MCVSRENRGFKHGLDVTLGAHKHGFCVGLRYVVSVKDVLRRMVKVMT